jgi:two-component system LytT family response regulator
MGSVMGRVMGFFKGRCHEGLPAGRRASLAHFSLFIFHCSYSKNTYIAGQKMPHMISAVLIDDEQHWIDELIYLFEENQLPVKVVATANSAKDGLTAILQHKPQIVFLDVVMPEMSGFEMLDLLPRIDFHLIITTSIDKFAIQAIRASALDFLLKPIKASELKSAVNRCLEKLESTSKVQIDLLAESLKERNHSIRKIAVSIADGIQLLPVDNLLYFESDGNYTTIHLKNDKKMVVSKAIGRFEEMLDPTLFFRVHNSYLVNLNYISKFIRKDGGYIELENGTTIQVARNRKDEFLEVLGKI